MAILSLVGKQMRNAIGLAGQMFATLAKGGINIEMISQGASEINISCGAFLTRKSHPAHATQSSTRRTPSRLSTLFINRVSHPPLRQVVRVRFTYRWMN
jgi:hypothetical protein